MKPQLVILMLGLLYICTESDAYRVSQESDSSPKSPQFHRAGRSVFGDKSGSEKSSDGSKKSHSGSHKSSSRSKKSSRGSSSSRSGSRKSSSGSEKSPSGSRGSRSGSNKSSSGSPGTKTGKHSPAPPPPKTTTTTTTTTTTPTTTTTTTRPPTTTTTTTPTTTTTTTPTTTAITPTTTTTTTAPTTTAITPTTTTTTTAPTTTTTTTTPTTTPTITITTSTTTTTNEAAATSGCSNADDYAEGEMYPIGVGLETDCAPGTVYNPELGICDWYNDVPACVTPDVMDCTDPSGGPLDGVSFTKSEDCEDGTYYKCISGIAIDSHLVAIIYKVTLLSQSGSIETDMCVNAPGRTTAYVFDPESRVCTEVDDESDCQIFSTDYVAASSRKRRALNNLLRSLERSE